MTDQSINDKYSLSAEFQNGYNSKWKKPKCINVLLQIASKVAAPLSKTNEIVILSGKGSQVTGEVNRLLAELPVSINALTGVDLSKVIACLGSWEKCQTKVSEVKSKECCVSTAPVAAEDDLKSDDCTSVSVVCTLTDFNTLEEFCSFIHILYTKWISETSGALLYLGPDYLHALLLIQDFHFISHGTCTFLIFSFFLDVR